MTATANAHQTNGGIQTYVPVNVFINVTVPAIKSGVPQNVFASVNLEEYQVRQVHSLFWLAALQVNIGIHQSVSVGVTQDGAQKDLTITKCQKKWLLIVVAGQTAD